MSDGRRIHFNVGGVSARTSEMVGSKSEITLYPFATEVRSFQIDSARDPQGLSTCTADPPYSLDNGSASQIIRFDDSTTSGWPVKSPRSVEIADASLVLRVTPDYPMFAQDQGIRGETRVFVVIEPDGSIGSESIERSSGSDLLDQAALDAARKSTFNPAHLSEALGGTAITRGYIIIYEFRLR